MRGALPWLYNILKNSFLWILGWEREKRESDDLHSSSQTEQNQGEELGIDQKECDDNSLGSMRQHNKTGTDVNLKLRTSPYRTYEIKSRESNRFKKDASDKQNSVDGSVSNSHIKTRSSVLRGTRGTYNSVNQSFDENIPNSLVKTTRSRGKADTLDPNNFVNQSFDENVSSSLLKTTKSRVKADTLDLHNSVYQRLDESVSDILVKTTGSRKNPDTLDPHNSINQSFDENIPNSFVKTTRSWGKADTLDPYNSVYGRFDESVSDIRVKTTGSRVKADTLDPHNSINQSFCENIPNSFVKTTRSRGKADTLDPNNFVNQSFDENVSSSLLKTTKSRVKADTLVLHNSVYQRLDESVSDIRVKTTGSREKPDKLDPHNSINQSFDENIPNSFVKTTRSRGKADTLDPYNSVYRRFDESVSNIHVKTTGSRGKTDTLDPHNSVTQSFEESVSDSHFHFKLYNLVNQRFGDSISNSHMKTTGSRGITLTLDTHSPVNISYGGSVSNRHASPLSLTDKLYGSKKELAGHRVLPKSTEKSFDNILDKNVISDRSSNNSASNTHRSVPINQRRPNPVVNVHKTKYVGESAFFKGGTPYLQRNQRRPDNQYKVLKPVFETSKSTRNRPSYNRCRRRIYASTNVDYRHIDEIQQFYDEKVKVDIASKFEAQQHVDYILQNVLKSRRNKGRFAEWADVEGSVAVGVKVGKADESDHSVDILVQQKYIELSDKPFGLAFEDDVDKYDIRELSTTFVEAGKRLFPEETRTLTKTRQRHEIPKGYIAARIGTSDSLKFNDCCIQRRKNSGDKTWFLPYYVLSAFHRFVGHAVQGLEYVTLNKGVKGPAVTLTVLQENGPNISIDITLKLTVPTKTLSVLDFGWPRSDTRKWLTEDKIDAVTKANIYLVPKGDKYWKISFANCEYELLLDIDMNNTWRKGCLRIMKKKFMIWQSQSKTGFKGLSSYLLKTTLLWLCEILPDDEFWNKDELGNRYLNFLQELENRLRKGSIGEYFNPSINLLENKDVDCIEELREFIKEEISLITD